MTLKESHAAIARYLYNATPPSVVYRLYKPPLPGRFLLQPLLTAPVKPNYFTADRRLTCSALKLILARADRLM